MEFARIPVGHVPSEEHCPQSGVGRASQAFPSPCCFSNVPAGGAVAAKEDERAPRVCSKGPKEHPSSLRSSQSCEFCIPIYFHREIRL